MDGNDDEALDAAYRAYMGDTECPHERERHRLDDDEEFARCVFMAGWDARTAIGAASGSAE